MVKPLAGFVLIENIELKHVVGSLFIADDKEKRSNVGRVISTGDPIAIDGEYKNSPVEKDNVVIYKNYSDYEVPGYEYKLVEFKDIIGIMEAQNE
jgi:co-chaperonin GroES (HSP10)